MAERAVGKWQCREDCRGVCCGCVNGCGRALCVGGFVARAGGLPPGPSSLG